MGPAWVTPFTQQREVGTDEGDIRRVISTRNVCPTNCRVLSRHHSTSKLSSPTRFWVISFSSCETWSNLLQSFVNRSLYDIFVGWSVLISSFILEHSNKCSWESSHVSHKGHRRFVDLY